MKNNPSAYPSAKTPNPDAYPTGDQIAETCPALWTARKCLLGRTATISSPHLVVTTLHSGHYEHVFGDTGHWQLAYPYDTSTLRVGFLRHPRSQARAKPTVRRQVGRVAAYQPGTIAYQ